MKWYLVSIAAIILAILFQSQFFKKTYKVHNSGAVLITGTSSGIGRDTAILFAKKGFTVFATVRKQSDADSVQKEHKNIVPIILDQSKEKDIIDAKVFIGDYLTKNKLQLVGIINNAAIVQDAPIEFHPVDSIRHLFEVNYFGVIRLTQAFIPFIRNSTGRIINVGSVAGEIAIPFFGAYSGTKFAIRAFTEALRRELIIWDIFVGLFSPSYVRTKIADNKQDIFSKISDENKKYYIAAFNEKKQKEIQKISYDLGESSDKIAVDIMEMFMNPRPNSRVIVGYGSYQVPFYSLFSDSFMDYNLEMFWNKDIYNKYHNTK